MTSRRAIASRITLAVALALGALVTSGCGVDYDRTDITGVKASPLGGSITTSRIEIPVGMIVKAHIVSYDDDRKEMDNDLSVKDPSVADVSAVISDRDYAFYGLRTGATEVEIRADGKRVLIITVVVTDQAPLP